MSILDRIKNAYEEASVKTKFWTERNKEIYFGSFEEGSDS